MPWMTRSEAAWSTWFVRKRAQKRTCRLITVHIKASTDDEYGINFLIHEDTLRKTSAFFRAALRGGWLESIQGIIKLPDVSPRVFGIYQYWAYTDRLDTTSGAPTPNTLDAEFTLLANCYVFGERILDSWFKDTIMDALLQLVRRYSDGHFITADHLELIFSNTKLPEGSPLREAMFRLGSVGLRAVFRSPIEIPQLFWDLSEAADNTNSIGWWDCEFHSHSGSHGGNRANCYLRHGHSVRAGAHMYATLPGDLDPSTKIPVLDIRAYNSSRP